MSRPLLRSRRIASVARVFAMVVWGAGLGVSAPARAAEDAGTLSPFAKGAGGRAMGMGGAFVASADDASALIWNPGGLARVTRLGFVADFAQMESSETGERFASLVMPSWRWGAVGIAMRQLGVSGIDARDDRNVEIPGELSASETELALGYGRAFGPGIGVGGTFKLQRSDVGRFSGSGIGVDLGLALEAQRLFGERAAWAAPWTMGLAVRNALEPAQRLDQESVRDPRLLRVGVAWHRDVSGSVGLTVATGWEQAASLSPRFTTGAELSLGSALALRSGLESGHFAAGSSVRLAGLSIDYAYEQRDLGTAQRVGISKAFGPSVEESRTAAQLAQERALAARLDAAYQQRLRDQVTGLLAQAAQSRAAGRFDEALQAVTAARALAPQDPKAAELEALLQRSEGERLLQSGDPAGAAVAFRRALEASPGDSLAARALRGAEAELAQQANRSKQARELDQAYGMFASGDLAGARTLLRRLHDLTPSDSATTALLGRVERLISERVAASVSHARPINVAPAPRVPAVAAPSDADRREADRHYRRGLQLASAGQTDNAIRFWELALTLDPGHAGARQALEREYLLRGMAAFGRGRFADAETYWSRAVELDPADVRARTYLERARTQLERTRELTGTGP